MSFSMNFNIDIDEEQRLMLVKIYGIWKRETALSYHREFIEVAQPLIGKKWAKIINLKNWKSSYPEMVRVIGEHMRWSYDNGNILAIYIIDNPVTKNQLKKMFSAGSVGPISKMVRTQAEADILLAQHGFK